MSPSLPPYLEQQAYLYRLNKARTRKHIDYSTPDGILAFVHDILNADASPYQEDVLYHFVENRRAAVRSLHGVGKTALSAWVTLWGISAFEDDVKVVTTASAHRQLVYFTWPEIRKWAQRANWSKLGMEIRHGKELLEYSIKLAGKQAFLVASDNPALIEGAHAANIIYVFDESKAIPVGTWDAAEGAFSTGNCFALAISTPGAPSGRFYDIHKRKPGTLDWWTRHITLQEAIEAGRVNPEWVEDRKQQWGETSAIYQNRVLGEFAESSEDSVIPLSWIEQSNERYRECGGKGTGETYYGADIARYGTDKTVLARIVGMVLEALDVSSKQDTMQTTGKIVALLDKTTSVYVDVIGIGAGVVDRLKELEYNVTPVNVGESTDMLDSTRKVGFVNLRSALWWKLREALDPNGEYKLAIPPDDILTGDLTAPLWTYTSNGKIKVESKDDIRARIGRSTDYADAAALAWFAANKTPSLPDVTRVNSSSLYRSARDNQRNQQKRERPR